MTRLTSADKAHAPLNPALPIQPTPSEEEKKKFSYRISSALTEGRLLSGLKRRLRPMIIRVGQAAMKQPLVRRPAVAILNLAPQFKMRLHRVLWSDVALSPRALRIFTELQAALVHERTLTAAHTQAYSESTR